MPARLPEIFRRPEAQLLDVAVLDGVGQRLDGTEVLLLFIWAEVRPLHLWYIYGIDIVKIVAQPIYPVNNLYKFCCFYTEATVVF